MLRTFDRFVEMDDECSSEENICVPATNDFVEGLHGILAELLQRLPINPCRATQLMQ